METDKSCLLSVVVPIFNAEKYLEQCIITILNQTWKDFELILVDDGSTDRSPEICDAIAPKDWRIRVIHQANGGAINARKTGLQEAKGEYITFPDADDWMEPDYFARMMRVVQDYQADIAAAGFMAETEEGQTISRENRIASGIYEMDAESPVRREVIYSGEFYTPGIIASLWSKVIRRSLFDGFSFSKKAIANGDDASWVYPALSRAKRIAVENGIRSYHYRMITGSLFFRYDETYLQSIVHLIRNMQENLTDDRMMTDGLRYYALFMVMDGVSRYMVPNILKKRREKVKDLQPVLDELIQLISSPDLDWSGFDPESAAKGKVLVSGDGKRVTDEYMSMPLFRKIYIRKRIKMLIGKP